MVIPRKRRRELRRKETQVNLDVSEGGVPHLLLSGCRDVSVGQLDRSTRVPVKVKIYKHIVKPFNKING